MQKSGLLKANISGQGDLDSAGAAGSDSSDEEQKRVPSPRGKRSRLNSVRSDKLREKLQSSSN